MTIDGEQILRHLRFVQAERERRTRDAELACRVNAVKTFQHARFDRTYADLLVDPRSGAAARFFMDDLYGPSDFTDRDAQFARIVPALVRLFPREIVGTVGDLVTLHALSERLDSEMGQAIGDAAVNSNDYGEAWRAVGQPAQREQQIALMRSVGDALDRHTRNPLLRYSLRLMRSPAQAAGLQALQSVLEKGFAGFRQMGGAAGFLDTIERRERDLALRLFAGGTV